MPAFMRLSTLLRLDSKCELASKLSRLSNPWLSEGRAFGWATWERPEGYRAEDGVSGIELRDGDSSEGLRRVCNCRPMPWETVEECLL